MTGNEIGSVIVDTAVHLHKKLGSGLRKRILNFGAVLMKDGIIRTVNGLSD